MIRAWTVFVLALALAAAPAAQPKKPYAPKPAPQLKAADDLPPLSYVCPMPGDEDVLEDKPGNCPKCGMRLQPIRLVSIWTCPGQPGLVARDKPGKCPVDGRDLVQMTMGLTWSCKDGKTESASPGTCADGSPMTRRYSLRAHGNHNPQHGGQFFMAEDNWHHLEGTYPRAGVFRVFLYDDFTKPLKLAEARKVTGQVVIQNVDPVTHVSTPGRSLPLALAPNGRYLEAKIGTVKLPASLQAQVTFKPTDRQSVFDFTFDKYSKEPTAAPPGTLTTPMPTTPATTPTTAPVAPFGGESGGAAPMPSGVDPALIPLPIPDTLPEILSQLRTRTEQIKGFIDKGLFGDVYVPAFQAKDLAIALTSHEDGLPPDSRSLAEPAIAKLVRASYLLDAFGDIGNKNQIVAAFAQFVEAEQIIQSAFARQ